MSLKVGAELLRELLHVLVVVGLAGDFPAASLE